MTGGKRHPRALVYVQHLLGIGHLARIARVAEGLVAAGVDVTLVQGGADAPIAMPKGVKLHRLLPARVTAEDMTTLRHADGQPFTESDKLARLECLLAILRDVKPDILVTEAFPFGRRQMRFELLPLLEVARDIGVSVIACSIRDILQESRKPGRAEETVEVLQRWYDLVLVHGDADLTPLELTFPRADAIRSLVRYTGLVGPPPPECPCRDHAVVVSAGGGVVGARLLEAAIAAAPLSAHADKPWLVIAGPNLPDEDFQRLVRQVAGSRAQIDFRRSVPDLAAHLAGARLSISQAGYNTVADILAVGCAAVLVPFAAGGETEQARRAEAMVAAGRAVIVTDDRLTPRALADAAVAALDLPASIPQRLEGGMRSAAILIDAYENALRRQSHMQAGKGC